MIKVICGVCYDELEEPGMLVFTKPDGRGKCHKIHICVECSDGMLEYIEDKEGK